MFLDRFFKRPPLDLYVSHYYRGHITADQHFPFHRALFIATDPTSDPPKGNLYQVHAVAGRFKYFQQSNVTVSLPDSFAGMVKVGEIRPPDLRIVEAIIQEVPIEDDPEVYWSGQEWTRDAVRRLAKGGFIDLALLSKLYHTYAVVIMLSGCMLTLG
jgi:hypothetical protein